MSDAAFSAIEDGMRFAQARSAVLAADAANARSDGFTAGDLKRTETSPDGGTRFGAVLQAVAAGGPSATLHYAMAASAANSLTYRALAEQERAMLHEFRLVADEARR